MEHDLNTEYCLPFSLQDKDINSIPLSSITSVNAVKSSQFSDTSMFYFEIHFKGTGSPWLLRTSKDLKDTFHSVPIHPAHRKYVPTI